MLQPESMQLRTYTFPIPFAKCSNSSAMNVREPFKKQNFCLQMPLVHSATDFKICLIAMHQALQWVAPCNNCGQQYLETTRILLLKNFLQRNLDILLSIVSYWHCTFEAYPVTNILGRTLVKTFVFRAGTKVRYIDRAGHGSKNIHFAGL